MVDINGNFMGVIVREAVAQEELFRGNCLGCKSPGSGVNCPGGIS